jgi:putative membrane protein insertion efficiency factor
MRSILVRLEIGFLAVYRAWSATRPLRCRYVPTCSAYAVEALHTHEFFKANRLIIRRLLRCHPWGGWGSDPVPPPVHRHVFSQGNHAQ